MSHHFTASFSRDGVCIHHHPPYLFTFFFSLMRFSLVAVIIATNCLITAGHDHACDPGKSAWVPYSGYRIQRELRMVPPFSAESTSNSMVIISCLNGKITNETKLPLHSTDADILWNTTLPVAENSAFKLVRRKKYAPRATSIYVPNTIVGGIYNCSSSCTPILPIMSDKIYNQWTFLDYREERPPSSKRKYHNGASGKLFFPDLSAPRKRLSVNHRIPYLFTPDIFDRAYPRGSSPWYTRLEPDENYYYYSERKGNIIPRPYQYLDNLLIRDSAAITFITSSPRSVILEFMKRLNEALHSK